MSDASCGVRSVEITRADKDATIDGVSVRRGQVIGLLDDRLVEAGDDLVAVTVATLGHADLAAAELITVLVGEGAPENAGEQLEAAMAAGHAGLDVEIVAGGQPHYDFVIAVE